MIGLRIDIRRKHYDRAAATQSPAIEGLQLRIVPGEFVCLVGPSGCGKSTLLNLLAGLDRHFEGQIEVEPPTGQAPRLGYVFQNPRLLPWRTVRENIELALPRDHDGANVDRLLEIVGLREAQDLYPERLSLGMSRRVALVRAFAIHPDLLLMDEPLVSLDPPTARRIRELILRLWQDRPHTVIFVTHDLREAIELGDRLVFLSPAPARVIGDIVIDLPRPQRQAEQLDAFIARLRDACPALTDLL